MRAFINIIVEAQEWTQEELVRYAGEYDRGINACSHPSGGLKADDLVWRYEPAYPVSRIDNWEAYEEMMNDDIATWKDEGDPERYSDMFDRPIQYPVVLSEVDGVGYMWDGCHRLGAILMKGEKTIAAVVGTPK